MVYLLFHQYIHNIVFDNIQHHSYLVLLYILLHQLYYKISVTHVHNHMNYHTHCCYNEQFVFKHLSPMKAHSFGRIKFDEIIISVLSLTRTDPAIIATAQLMRTMVAIIRLFCILMRMNFRENMYYVRFVRYLLSIHDVYIYLSYYLIRV